MTGTASPSDAGAPEANAVILPPIVIRLGADPRPDGYTPLALALLEASWWCGWSQDAAWRYLLSAARRLDSAHRQFERLRAALDARDPGRPNVEEALDLMADAELAAISMYRAFQMARDLAKTLGVQLNVRFPKRVASRMTTVEQMRHAFEHIGDRAIGRVKGGDPRWAQSVFRAGGPLLDARRLRYGQWSLSVDEPATMLMRDVRRYLRYAWRELCLQRAQYSERCP